MNDSFLIPKQSDGVNPTSRQLCSPQTLAPRERVITEAMSWLGTSFHFGGRVKISAHTNDRGQPCQAAAQGCFALHGCVDCAQFIAAVYEACDVFKAEDYGFFGPDWHMNTSEEHYKYRLLRHAAQLPTSKTPQPGDIALVKSGEGVKVFSAGGIVLQWPLLIHACPKRGIAISSADLDPLWMGWEKEFFDPFALVPAQ
jgi:cell wall-associated NlpC family hydrolase